MSLATIEATQIGQLANLYCLKTLPLQVMHSSAGYYIGTCDENGLPVSRESAQYWKTREGLQNSVAGRGSCMMMSSS